MEGTGTDEAEPHSNDLGKPALFECARCMRVQGCDREQASATYAVPKWLAA